MALFLTEADVSKVISLPAVMGAVEAALREHGTGQADNRPRQRARLGRVTLQTMNAALPDIGRAGLKAYITGIPKDGPNPAKVRFWVMLFNESGRLLALMHAGTLGQVRTGCASGIAANYMARADAQTVGLIGAGYYARTQLTAICHVRAISEARVYSRNPARATAFCHELGAELGRRVRVVPVPSAEAAVRDADIAVTITTAKNPVLQGQWLSPGTTILAAGSNRADARELDTEAVARCGLVVTDSLEQAQMESGDLLGPVAEGKLDWKHVRELGAVVAGRVPGRRNDDEINLFKSNGIALEDVAAAQVVYERALALGVGIELPVD